MSRLCDKILAYPDFGDHDDPSQLSRPKRRWRDQNIAKDFPDQHGDGATFKKSFQGSRGRGGDGATKNQGGDDLTFRTKAETARLFRPRQRRRNFSDRCRDGSTKIIFLATEVDTVRLSRPRRRRPDFPDQSRDGWLFRPRRRRRNFQTEAETARPRLQSSRLRWIRCDFPDQSGDGMTFQTKAETVRFSISRRRRRNQELILRHRGGCGASLAIRVCRRPKPRQIGATFQTMAQTAQFSRPRRRRRNQESIARDRGGYASLSIPRRIAQNE